MASKSIDWLFAREREIVLLRNQYALAAATQNTLWFAPLARS